MNGSIRIADLTYNYSDGVKALDRVSISVPNGEKVALIGPNGAGKSTLLLHINGTLRGHGSVEVGGLCVTDDSIREVRRKVGLIFQDPGVQLFSPTVRDDVAFGPMHFEQGREALNERVSRALAEVDMTKVADRPSHHLSMGEKRRITIASVLSYDPEILALDEPAAMLDPKRRRWLINFIKASHKTIILATHDLEFAAETCSRAVLMRSGRIVSQGEMSDVIGNKQLLEDNELEQPSFLRAFR